jgi:hypothetical protein
MKLPDKQKAIIIIGTLLGDGCLECNGKSVRLRLEHGVSQEQYLLWKYNEFKKVATPSSPMKVHAYHKVHQKFYDSLRMYTFSNESFKLYWDVFYQNGRKIVPKNILKLLTEPISLAVWFMDDGYKRNDCNAFRLNTDSFLKQEQLQLIEVLKKNFNIESTLHKKGKHWNIYIPQRSSKRFVEIVKPYIIPSLEYKIAIAP